MLLDKFSAGRQCLDDFIEDVSKDLQVGGLRLDAICAVRDFNTSMT